MKLSFQGPQGGAMARGLSACVKYFLRNRCKLGKEWTMRNSGLLFSGLYC